MQGLGQDWSGTYTVTFMIYYASFLIYHSIKPIFWLGDVMVVACSHKIMAQVALDKQYPHKHIGYHCFVNGCHRFRRLLHPSSRHRIKAGHSSKTLIATNPNYMASHLWYNRGNIKSQVIYYHSGLLNFGGGHYNWIYLATEVVHCFGYNMDLAKHQVQYVLVGNGHIKQLKENKKIVLWNKSKTTNKLHGLSPRANYTDRATAASRRSGCQLLRIKCATWSAW
jgi:hypothetical protein